MGAPGRGRQGSRRDRSDHATSASGSRAWSARTANSARPTRSSRPRRCFSPRNSIRPDRSEPLHRRAPQRASGSSSSAGPWACRRPRTTSAPRASAQRASSRTSGCWRSSARSTRPTTRPTATAARGRRCCAPASRSPRCQVQRLMREHGIQGAKRRGKPWRTTISDPNATRPADLVERDFTAAAPDRLWVCDFTRLRCWDGVLYFAFVIDVYSRRVVGWQLATHMRDTLVIDALRMALCASAGRARTSCSVVHSDAGSQYTSLRPHPGPRRSRRAAVDRDRRRRAGQRPRRIASWTPSRPSSSATAPGRPGPAWSSRSSSTSAGSTTTACTAPSATSHPPSSKPYTHHASLSEVHSSI